MRTFIQLGMTPLKTIMITRAYYTSALNAITSEMIMDTPYNIVTNIQDSSELISDGNLDLSDPRKYNMFMYDIDNLLFWTVVGVSCVGFNFYYYRNENKLINRLNGIIQYSEINLRTKQCVFILFYILTKNVHGCA